jgi:hypothetical protein
MHGIHALEHSRFSSGNKRGERTVSQSRPKNIITVGELYALAGAASEPGDGVHELQVERVYSSGGNTRLVVTTADGDSCEVPIGRLTDRRTLNRNLRLLLGRTDLDSVEKIRAELEGRWFRLRLNTYEYRGTMYRGVERP